MYALLELQYSGLISNKEKFYSPLPVGVSVSGDELDTSLVPNVTVVESETGDCVDGASVVVVVDSAFKIIFNHLNYNQTCV